MRGRLATIGIALLLIALPAAAQNTISLAAGIGTAGFTGEVYWGLPDARYVCATSGCFLLSCIDRMQITYQRRARS